MVLGGSFIPLKGVRFRTSGICPGGVKGILRGGFMI